VLISVLNYLYVKLTNWFTTYENYQYEYDYESALIWRII